MRLLYVIHSFPPESRGGSEIACHRVAVDMAESGHDVHVLTRIADEDAEDGLVRVTEENGVTVHRVNRTYRNFAGFEATYASPMVESLFERMLRDVRPDLVHFHHLTHLSLRLPTIAKAHRLPVVFTLHDYWLFCQLGQLLTIDQERCSGPRPGRCARCCSNELFPGPRAGGTVPPWRHLRGLLRMRKRLRLGRRQWRSVDLFLSSSDYLRGWFLSLGMPEQQIVTLDNGYDPSQFESVPPVRPDGRLTFGYIGNLIPSKGIHVLVDAFQRVEGAARLEVHGAYSVYHPGFEDYEKQLRASANHDERIRFEGSYEPMRAAEIMARLDVVVVPSIWYENSPLTIHEAFLARRAVITSGMGGMKELVEHEKNGLLFVPEDPVDLARQIQRMVDDPSLVDRLAVGGPVLAIGDLTSRLEETYERLLSGNGRGPAS